MTDRELLELAAKAAGYTNDLVWSFDALFWIDDSDGAAGDVMWSPLTDDGDALRLAIKLELTIHQWPDEICVCNEKGTINEDVARVGNIYAATRRAIVRAAAEIGRSME